MLVVLVGLAAGGCGGSDGSSDNAGSKSGTTSGAASQTANSSSGGTASTSTGSSSSSGGANKQSSPSGQASHGSAGDRFPGVYAETFRLCSQGSVERVAASVGTKSTNHTEIARAMAHGYLPKFRKRAFSGCLKGLKIAAALK
jgi:hypothetical protein